jgi:predicted HTH domain antitoxin
MSHVAFDIPEDALVALKIDPSDAARELLLAASVKLCEIGRLSSGMAARLAGLPRVAFLMKLADYGEATFRLGAEDLASDLDSA